MTKPKNHILSLDLLESDDDIDVESELVEDHDVPISKPYDPKLIRVDPKVFSLRNILDMIDDGDLELAPDFQRLKVWTPRQKSRLIESILLRIPLPAFYFSSDKSGNMQVVDGLQRLSTIHEFVRNKTFSLVHLEYLDQELGGENFKELEGTPWAKRIYTTQISAHVIDPQTPSRVKFDIFKRINTGGAPLNAQEIRHCMGGDGSRKLLKSLCALKSFDEATGNKLAGSLRMADRELALRWVAFYLLHDIKDYGTKTAATMEEFLNDTAERIDLDKLTDLDEIIDIFNKTMKLAISIFGTNAFRKWPKNDTRRYPLNKAIFESLGVTLAKLHPTKPLTDKKIEKIRDNFRELCRNDKRFMDSITAGTGDPLKVRQRFEKLAKIME